MQDATMAGPPSPGSVAADLTTFNNSMPPLTNLDNLISSLATAETNLFLDFPVATTNSLLTQLADFR
jgi:hypothetical protein